MVPVRFSAPSQTSILLNRVYKPCIYFVTGEDGENIFFFFSSDTIALLSLIPLGIALLGLLQIPV
jgi:hypothetical protein